MKCLIFFFLIDKEIKKLKLLAYLKMSSAQFICISSDEDDDYVPPSILNLSTQQQVKSKESPELSKIGNFFLLIFCQNFYFITVRGNEMVI